MELFIDANYKDMLIIEKINEDLFKFRWFINSNFTSIRLRTNYAYTSLINDGSIKILEIV